MAVTEIWGPTWVNVVWDGTSDYTLSKAIVLTKVSFHSP